MSHLRNQLWPYDAPSQQRKLERASHIQQFDPACASAQLHDVLRQVWGQHHTNTAHTWLRLRHP
jgi:hypothetical protein